VRACRKTEPVAPCARLCGLVKDAGTQTADLSVKRNACCVVLVPAPPLQIAEKSMASLRSCNPPALLIGVFESCG
jgi:hypothetical protein